MRQAPSNIYLEISNINFQSLLGLATAHTGAGEPGQDLLAQRLGQLVQFAADRGLMHRKSSCDFSQGAAIEIVRGQDETIFGRERGEGFVRSTVQSRIRHRRGRGDGRDELGAFLGFLV